MVPCLRLADTLPAGPEPPGGQVPPVTQTWAVIPPEPEPEPEQVAPAAVAEAAVAAAVLGPDAPGPAAPEPARADNGADRGRLTGSEA